MDRSLTRYLTATCKRALLVRVPVELKSVCCAYVRREAFKQNLSIQFSSVQAPAIAKRKREEQFGGNLTGGDS
jgi:hypothetical protein